MLPMAPAMAHGAPTGARVELTQINACGGMEQRSTLNIPLGQSTTFTIDDVIRARAVGNPAVVQSMQVNPSSLYLVGTHIGSTNMMLQGRKGTCYAATVTVSADTTGLLQAIATLMPDEQDVHVSAAADALVLSGQVADAVQAQRIVELAQRFVSTANTPVSNLPATGTKAAAADQQKETRVINMLTVAAPQQVMLEVKVAEVSKTLIDELGLNLKFGSSSSWAGSIGTLLKFGGPGGNNFGLDAQKTEQPVKLLAEPNLMAISGQKASFMAGGKVFIPVPQSATGGALMVTMQEETFGVKLNFTPTVLRGGLINLQVSPEVSQLSGKGLMYPYGESREQPLPVIDTRSASTTVQLRDGQSYAIGGLLKNDMRGDVSALPGLGQIPVLGALFRSTSYRAEKTELVFIVTPHLVKPLTGPSPLATDTFGKVTSADLYSTVNMEGHPPQPAPSASPQPPAGDARQDDASKSHQE